MGPSANPSEAVEQATTSQNRAADRIGGASGEGRISGRRSFDCNRTRPIASTSSLELEWPNKREGPRPKVGGPVSFHFTPGVTPMATASTSPRSPDQLDQIRESWLTRLNELVDQIDRWSVGFGWSSRWVDKKMDDPEVGSYRAPALLLQEGVTRIILEPIARSSPGTDGVVDLYQLPAYDDIATLFFRQGRWLVRYPLLDDPIADPAEAADLKPLTSEVVRAVLAEMIRDAS